MDDLPHILVRSSVLKRQLSTWGATAQPDGSRPGNTSPTYPVCRQSAQVSGMPSVLAEPDGEARRVVHEDPRIPVRPQGGRPHRRPVQ